MDDILFSQDESDLAREEEEPHSQHDQEQQYESGVLDSQYLLPDVNTDENTDAPDTS